MGCFTRRVKSQIYLVLLTVTMQEMLMIEKVWLAMYS